MIIWSSGVESVTGVAIWLCDQYVTDIVGVTNLVAQGEMAMKIVLHLGRPDVIVGA
jgi:hypothetical protein